MAQLSILKDQAYQPMTVKVGIYQYDCQYVRRVDGKRQWYVHAYKNGSLVETGGMPDQSPTALRKNLQARHENEEKRGRGRPTKTNAQGYKGNIIQFRISDDEKALLERLAAKKGIREKGLNQIIKRLAMTAY